MKSYQPEYPSAAFLSSSIAFVSDGNGSMSIFNIPESGPATLLGSFNLPHNIYEEQPIPFRVHSIFEVSPVKAIAILSSKCYNNTSETSEVKEGQRKTAHVEFDIWAAQFSLPITQLRDDLKPMDILWRRRGEHVPMFNDYVHSREAYLLIGGSAYRSIGTPAPQSYEPSADELASIPRQNDQNMEESGAIRPPPYSWTQTNDEVTIAFPLPSTTEKSNIKVSFSSRTLTVHVQTDELAASVAPPRYSMKQLWDNIQPSTSFWTWDRQAENSFGLLTLHLDKQNDGTRWMHVFASTGTSVNPEDKSDVEVPETLDPSELWKIRESLEKYTSSLRDGEDTSGLGLGGGVPSLAGGEMDDEVDMSVGRQAYLTWIAADGSTLSTDDEVSFNLLSTTIPGFKTSEISVVVKNGLDGVVFSAPTWKHSATFSALAFVLASKQDTRFTYHIPSHAVLAFENGTRDRGGNVYIYRSARTSEKWAKQTVFKVGQGSSGSLVGVGALKINAEKYVILCLCERELVVIHDIV